MHDDEWEAGFSGNFPLGVALGAAAGSGSLERAAEHETLGKGLF